jgi:glucose/arabinose dehydrogenase
MRELSMTKEKNLYPLFVFAAACMLLTGLSNSTCAQSQSDSAPSVAEAARRAREKKKENAKPVRTLTNDDLPAGDAVTGTATPTPAAKGEDAVAPAANDDGEKKPPASANDEKAKMRKEYNAAALERAKKQLAQLLSELDIMERKAVLDSDSYYSKTDYASDKDGKANLDAEAQQISDKKQAADELKARVAELQAIVGDSTENESDKTDNSDKTEKNPPSR